MFLQVHKIENIHLLLSYIMKKTYTLQKNFYKNKSLIINKTIYIKSSILDITYYKDSELFFKLKSPLCYLKLVKIVFNINYTMYFLNHFPLNKKNIIYFFLIISHY